MPDERDKPGGEPDADGWEETEHERPTVNPPFDPVAFARDVSKPSPPGVPAVAPGSHTRVTPALGSTQARAGAASRPPRRKTPATTLSLANARIPSDLPPAASSSAPDEPPSAEDEWAEVELSAPPAGAPPSDALELSGGSALEIGADAQDAGEDEHAAVTVRNPVEAIIGGHPRPLEEEMRDRVSLGDYTGALEVAEKILAARPEHAEAEACAASCRNVLLQMYATRIGPLDRVPVVTVPRDQLRWLSIDHRAGFVLSLVDGVSTFEMILDVSGMPALETLRILSELAQQRVISLR